MTTPQEGDRQEPAGTAWFDALAKTLARSNSPRELTNRLRRGATAVAEVPAAPNQVHTGQQAPPDRDPDAERRRWDAAVQALGGSVLQSWQWGEWYRHGGWQVERIRVDGAHGTGLAQLLFWPRDPVTEAHLSLGPVLGGDGPALVRDLFAAVDDVCARYRPCTLIVEPTTPLPLSGTYEAAGFVQGTARWCCPGRTVVVPLLDDGALLQQMSTTKRYEVRQAERRGVAVEQAVPDATALARFYELLEETARRNEFTLEPFSYYEDFMRHLVDEAILLFARTERGVVAGLIMTCFGHDAIYHFAASSTTLRVPGATAYLNFQAMRLARAYGCTRYDMWGIPDEDPPPAEGDPSRSRGGDWRGMYHFKISFGGDIITYPLPLERRYPARPWRAFWRRSEARAVLPP